MKAPDTTTPLYWHVAGSIVAAHARADGKPDAITTAEVEDRSLTYATGLKLALANRDETAAAYHKAHLVALVLALEDRRVSGWAKIVRDQSAFRPSQEQGEAA